MSEEGNLQFVWDIMLQSEWWKKYWEMVRLYGPEDLAGSFCEEQSSWSDSGTCFWSGSQTGDDTGISSASSGAWWMEIPEDWWSSFAGSGADLSSGEGLFGSAGGLGYGLSLI